MVNLMPAIVALSASVDLSTITSAISSIVTAAIQWTTSWATEIVSTPLLLFFVVFGAVGFGLGAIFRVIHR